MFFLGTARAGNGHVVKVHTVERSVVPEAGRAIIPYRRTYSRTRVKDVEILSEPDETRLLNEIALNLGYLLSSGSGIQFGVALVYEIQYRLVVEVAERSQRRVHDELVCTKVGVIGPVDHYHVCCRGILSRSSLNGNHRCLRDFLSLHIYSDHRKILLHDLDDERCIC